MSEHRVIEKPASKPERPPGATRSVRSPSGSTTTAPAAPAPEISPLRVGLAGCGVVGGALVALVREQTGRIRREHGMAPVFPGVLVRDPLKPRPVDLSRSTLTDDPAAFLEADYDVVIEAIGGIQPAATIARTALGRGIPFITANKAMVAVHGPDLARLARRTGAAFRFEAAVAGGVPVVRTLRDAFRGVTVRRIRGILNGTSNYVLHRMSADGLSLDEALADARRRGYAEADATRDLDGRDAADKLAILAWLAFGIEPARLEVDRRGILPDPDRLLRTAAGEGLTVRLLAECERTDDGVNATVAPRFLAADSELARTAGAGNRIEIETEEAGTYTLAGPGAGGMATASALLADLLDARQRA